MTALPAESTLGRALAGEDAGWSLETQLLAALHDRLAEANWQRANEGTKSPSRRPTPLPRPGVRPDRIGGTQRDPREVAAYLARWQPVSGGEG
ncbi:hypothetical protein SLA_2191 [Streptomyces laurentii]|uniref:Uncharacterized protein n=1 Tax=Streptomyces laurentii TaxID=39478 RepID=A0A160NY30_STRLU|nr:hypothetical protein SLA_2191 [Streptomyces laurentii]